MNLLRLSVAFLLAALLHLWVAILPLGNQPGPPAIAYDQPITITISRPAGDQAKAEKPAAVIPDQALNAPSIEPERRIVEPEKRPLPEPVNQLKELPQPRQPEKISPRVDQGKRRHEQLPAHVPAKAERQQRFAPQIQAPPAAPARPAGKSRQTSQSPVVSKARYLNTPKPVYPPLAIRRRWQGTVELQVVVEADGSVSSCRLETSSGYAVLDKSALRTVKNWRFIPEKQAGIARQSMVLVPVQFVLP